MKSNTEATAPRQCQRIQQQFALLLGGELQGPKAWWVWRHIDSCALCRTELSAMRGLDAELRRADIVPEGLRARQKNAVGRHLPRRAGAVPR